MSPCRDWPFKVGDKKHALRIISYPDLKIDIYIMEYLDRWFEYEKNFNAEPSLRWHVEMTDIPIITIAVYLAIVFGVPKILKKPLPLKSVFAVWNLGLSVFSIIGVTRVVPHLYNTIQKRGFEYSICETPMNWYAHGPVGLWMMLFIYSKIPELCDTFFLVLRGKKVIFLHWFHHVTVLLYCWHAYHTKIASGIWFAAMNYSVHSVMYFYYFMANIGCYHIVRPFAILITIGQISQMVGGLTVLLNARRISQGGRFCDNDAANVRLGLAMYFSYFLLFCFLFYEKYMVKKINQSIPQGCVDDIAKVDTSGMFRSDQNASSTDLKALDKKKK